MDEGKETVAERDAGRRSRAEALPNRRLKRKRGRRPERGVEGIAPGRLL